MITRRIAMASINLRAYEEARRMWNHISRDLYGCAKVAEPIACSHERGMNNEALLNVNVWLSQPMACRHYQTTIHPKCNSTGTAIYKRTVFLLKYWWKSTR
jgi:hypothetical protein